MRRVLTVGALLALLGGLVSPLLAQPAGWDGLFVVAGDGSVWVIRGTTRHPIQLVPIDDDTLARFDEGDPIASLDQLEPPAPDQPAAAPSPAPAESPASTLLGQSAPLCKERVPISVWVERAEWTKTAGGVVARGAWVLLIVQATNNGSRAQSLNIAAELRDDRNRAFPMAGMFDAPVAGLARRYGVNDQFAEIPPHATLRVLLLFAVPRDAGTLRLVPTNWGC